MSTNMTSPYMIQRVGDRYWLSKYGWRQGSFPTLDAAVREHQMRRRLDRKARR
jgi:hypothetical protein